MVTTSSQAKHLNMFSSGRTPRRGTVRAVVVLPPHCGQTRLVAGLSTHASPTGTLFPLHSAPEKKIALECWVIDLLQMLDTDSNEHSVR
jgi:hypothetical protein